MILNPYKYYKPPTGGGGFDMLDYSPVAWLDIADITKIYDADTGGSQITDGGAVGRVEDKSGNDNHAIQTVALDRTTYNASDAGANGNPSLNAPDTTRDYGLAMPTMSFRSFAVVTAYKDGLDSTFDTYTTLIGGDKATNSRYRIAGNLNNDDLYSDTGIYLVTVSKNGAADSMTVLPMALSTLIGQWANNVVDQPTTAVGYGPLSLGQGRAWVGPICEVALFADVLTSQQKTEIHEGLAAKWGI